MPLWRQLENLETMKSVRTLCENVLRSCMGIVDFLEQTGGVTGEVILPPEACLSICTQIDGIRNEAMQAIAAAQGWVDDGLNPLDIVLRTYGKILRLDYKLDAIISGNSLPPEITRARGN